MRIPISQAEIERRITAAETALARMREHHALELEAAQERLAAARALTPVAKPRIDKLEPGVRVRLFFASTYNAEREEDAVFLGITGEGDDREATFASVFHGETEPTKWRAYRYEGRWAYGSGAERLVLIDVYDKEEVTT